MKKENINIEYNKQHKSKQRICQRRCKFVQKNLNKKDKNIRK